jgi:hypothetical protein
MVYDDGVLYQRPRHHIPIWSEDRKVSERPKCDDSTDRDDLDPRLDAETVEES